MRRRVLVFGASVVLASLTWFPGHAQERKDDKKPAAVPEVKPEAKPAAPPAAPQEKVEIPGAIDSWYKILQGDMHIGYVHEILTRSGPPPVRYDYNILAEIETEVPDPQEPTRKIPSTESAKLRSRLDDTYAPIDMELRVQRDNAEMVSTIVQTESGRRMDVKLPDLKPRTFMIRSDMDPYYTTHLMFLSMRQNDVLSRTGVHTAKILFPRGDESPLVEVSFEVKEWSQREYLEKKFSVTRIEWIKPLPAPTRDLEIVETYVDKYGRVVEETTRGPAGLRFVLAKGEEEAVGQSTHIRVNGRHDPFRKDLALQPKPKGDRSGPTGPTPDDIAIKKPDDGLALGEKLMEDLKKAAERKDKVEARALYDRIIQIYIKLKEATKDGDSQIKVRVENLKKRVEELFPGAEMLVDKARKVYAAALDRFEHEDVSGMEKLLGELRDFEKSPELVGSAQTTQLRQWVAQLEPLLDRCRTRLELARKKLTLTGVVLHLEEKPQTVETRLNVFGHAVGTTQEVRFIRATHFAIINEKMYKVGDTVEGEGVRVEKVWKYGVQVSLQEETREVGIRQ
jgi:hypothetical protein